MDMISLRYALAVVEQANFCGAGTVLSDANDRLAFRR